MVKKIYDYLFHQNHPLAWSVTMILIFGIVMTINYKMINVGDLQSTFIIASTGILLYSIYSAVMLLLAPSMTKAWNVTLFGFILVAIGITGLGMLLTGTKWSEISFYTSILKVITFVTLVFMSIAVSMRKIVEYAQRLDR